MLRQCCGAGAMCAVALEMMLFGQAPGPVPALVTIIEVEAENYTCYYQDTADYAKLATGPGSTSPAPARTFANSVCVADLVRINGQVVKGTWTARAVTINTSPTPQPGQNHGDAARTLAVDWIWEILQADGSAVGTIVATGLGMGAPPPGAPAAVSRTAGSAMAITGGTGAYLGVQGQAGIKQMTASRDASVSEDPANRRSRAGGAVTFLLHLLPVTQPTIWMLGATPWISHSDGSLVSAAKPAVPGEELMLVGIGLGPLRAPIDPGELFPRVPVGEVSSPIAVNINGRPAEVTKKVGWPEMYDVYEVRVRLPAELLPGTASLRLVAAWIPGPEYRIPIGRP